MWTVTVQPDAFLRPSRLPTAVDCGPLLSSVRLLKTGDAEERGLSTSGPQGDHRLAKAKARMFHDRGMFRDLRFKSSSYSTKLALTSFSKDALSA